MKLLKGLLSAALAVMLTAAPISVNASAFSIRTDLSFTAECGSGSSNFDSVEAAAIYVRDCIRNRDNTIKFSLPIRYDFEEAFHSIILQAVDETYSGSEGDYIKYVLKSIECKGGYDGVNYYYTINMNYYTNAEQERYVDRRVSEILSSLDLDGKDDYAKISAIYEYIINNVEYDYSDDESNKARFTSYGALYNGKAVCQGFSQLFYRMAKELGLSCRIISGTADGGHAWNIVAVDGIYYYVDTTWDIFNSDISDCDYFMRGSLDFDEADRTTPHIASGKDPKNFLITDFTSAEFKAAYPVSDYAYDAEKKQIGYVLGDVNSDGVVDSADASEILNGYAMISIYNYSGMTAAQELAADVDRSKSIDSSDASAVLDYYGYVSTGGKLSLEEYNKKVK